MESYDHRLLWYIVALLGAWIAGIGGLWMAVAILLEAWPLLSWQLLKWPILLIGFGVLLAPTALIVREVFDPRRRRKS